jgi:hypothetical protein
MTLSTYAGLKSAVADWATNDALTSQIPDFVSWAHQEICRKLRAPVLYARSDVTVSAETASAPTGFLAAKRFYLDTSPRVELRVASSETVIDMTSRFGTGTYPSHFAVEGTDTLAFAPLFSTSSTGKLLYYKAPTTLSADADTNVVLTKYPFLYLYGALEALFRYQEDDNNADRYGALFGALLSDINGKEAADALSGPLGGQASGTVV